MSPPSLEPNSSDPLDMESEFEQLEKDQHKACEDHRESHHTEQSNQLKEVLKKVHDSAVARARAAHGADLEHQKNEN